MKEIRAYIAAPESVDIQPVQRFLKREGIVVEDAYSTPLGTNQTDHLLRLIRSVDFAIAILSETTPWTAYELGLCDALKKPVILILQPNLSPPPFITLHPHVRSNLKQSDVWQLALKKFIEDIRETRGRPTPRQPRLAGAQRDSDRLKQLYQTIRDIREDAKPRDVERICLEVLRAAGVSVAAQDPSLSDRGADFAVWDDALAQSIGLPLFIEVKAGDLDDNQLLNAERQLASAVQKTSGRFGLVLYLDRKGQRFSSPAWTTPYVIRFDLEDFARKLSQSSFAQLLLEQRNKLVHGLG
jgi:hypothetical protein